MYTRIPNTTELTSAHMDQAMPNTTVISAGSGLTEEITGPVLAHIVNKGSGKYCLYKDDQGTELFEVGVIYNAFLEGRLNCVSHGTVQSGKLQFYKPYAFDDSTGSYLLHNGPNLFDGNYYTA